MTPHNPILIIAPAEWNSELEQETREAGYIPIRGNELQCTHLLEASTPPPPLIAPPKLDYSKMIDCAAVQTKDGRVWTGKRHHHCFATIHQATGKSCWGSVQGFVTMERNPEHPQGCFVTREEAMRLCRETGQVASFVSPFGLFSEDLY